MSAYVCMYFQNKYFLSHSLTAPVLKLGIRPMLTVVNASSVMDSVPLVPCLQCQRTTVSSWWNQRVNADVISSSCFHKTFKRRGENIRRRFVPSDGFVILISFLRPLLPMPVFVK